MLLTDYKRISGCSTDQTVAALIKHEVYTDRSLQRVYEE